MIEEDNHQYVDRGKRKQKIGEHLPDWIVILRDEYIRQSEKKDIR